MKKSINQLYILFLLIIGCLSAKAQSSAFSDVNVMIQAGHTIDSFTITNNERYVLTSDRKSIALWDLRKRKIINKLSVKANEIYAHPIVPTYVCVVPYPYFLYKLDYLPVYDMITGKKMDRIEKSRIMAFKDQTRDFTLKLKNGIIDIYLEDSDKLVGSLNSVPLPLSGSLDIDPTNNKRLLVGGLNPAIWDFGELNASFPIDYYKYLKNIESGGYITVSGQYAPLLRKIDDPNTYRTLEYKRTTNSAFEKDGTIRICGYDGDISYWKQDGSLKKVIKAQSDVGPIFNLQKCDDNFVGATYEGICTSKHTPSLRINDYFQKNIKGFHGDLYKNCMGTIDISRPFRGSKYITCADGHQIVMGDFNNPSFFDILFITPFVSYPQGIKIDDTENYFLTFGGNALLWESSIDNTKNRISYTARLGGETIKIAEYLPDDVIAAGTSNGILAFWKRGKQDAFKLESQHNEFEILDIKVAPDKKRFYSLDKSGSVVIWDTADLAPKMYMHPLGSGDYLYITPDHYYCGSRKIYDKVHFTSGLNIYDIEQYDLLFNRPDIVCERLGGSKDKIDLLHKAWERRVRRMGFKPEDIIADTQAPSARITNSHTFPHTTTDSGITLNIRLKDSKYKLTRLMISVNGVPLESRMGIDISSLGVSDYSTKKDIELASGRNHIEVSCINEKGVESYKSDINILCTKPSKKPTLYLASIGVSDYLDKGYTLEYAAKDAEDFQKLINGNLSESYSDVKTLCIKNKEAIASNIQNVKDFFANAGVDDVIMLFYAGHGVLDEDLNYYLSTYDMDFRVPSAKGVSYDDFEDILDGIKPLSKYCFIDACHSGKIDKEEFIEDNSNLVAKGSVKFRGDGKTLKISDEVKSVNNAIQSLFMDFSKGNGASVLVSSSGMEVAIEDNKISNGLFTYSLKQGLGNNLADTDKDGTILMSELSEFVSKNVVKLSNGIQTPGMRVENKYTDLRLK